jgi:ankyrin repeat protein
MDAPYNKIPPLFRKLEEMSVKPGDFRQQVKEILDENPNVLNEVHADLSVYSFATLLGLRTLRIFHQIVMENIGDNSSYEIPSPSNKKRAIHYAVENSTAELVDFLLHDVGVDINVVDARGDTPLHMACKHKKIKIVQLLLVNGGMNVNIVNKHRQTPLMLCLANDSVEIASLLLKRGAQFEKMMDGVMRMGSNDMIILFKGHERNLKNKRASKKRDDAYTRITDRLKKDFVFVCNELDNNNNLDAVLHLASKLHVQHKFDDKDTNLKKHLCGLISEKVLLKKQFRH